MEKLKLDIPAGFFEGEERCGYYVSPEMKKVWAVELDLLNEFMTVCNRYNIHYFVAAGTLLGAARHKGFIPWDDDIDVFMKRSEYMKFLKIARSGVFKEPYFWQDHITDPSYLGGPTRLRNSNTTVMGPRYIEDKHGIRTEHYGIFLDVIPLDNLPDDIEARNEWMARIQKLARMAWDLRMFTHRGLFRDRKDLEWLDFWFNLTNSPNQLFEIYDELLGETAYSDTKYSCLYYYYFKDPIDKWCFVNADLNDFCWMPFEMLTVPVPTNYDAVLTKMYGDWHQFVRGGTQHEICDNPLSFDTDHPYTYYVDPVSGIRKDLVRNLLNMEMNHSSR